MTGRGVAVALLYLGDVISCRRPLASVDDLLMERLPYH